MINVVCDRFRILDVVLYGHFVIAVDGFISGLIYLLTYLLLTRLGFHSKGYLFNSKNIEYLWPKPACCSSWSHRYRLVSEKDRNGFPVCHLLIVSQFIRAIRNSVIRLDYSDETVG